MIPVGKWIHIKCDGTSNDKYEELKLLNKRAELDPTVIPDDWQCLRCKIKFQYDNVPFMFQDNIDIENLNNTDSNKFFEMLPKFNIMSEINNLSNKAHDIDANIDDPINCKYYSVEELKMISRKKALNIFHSNVNGLDTHFDNLHEFLANANSPVFDIINISETSQQCDLNFKTNVNMKGYNMFTNGPNSEKGG